LPAPNSPAGQRLESTTGGTIDTLTDGATLNDKHAVIDRLAAAPAVRHRGVLPVMSLRKPLSALAAVTAALALAVPATSASAAPTAPAPHSAFIGAGGRLVPGSLPCRLLVWQIRGAVLTGNTVWANLLSNVFLYSGCGGAAI
jgi:hypothetical protein